MSTAACNDVVITDAQSLGGSIYSISGWLDEQLRNPLAASSRVSPNGWAPVLPLARDSLFRLEQQAVPPP